MRLLISISIYFISYSFLYSQFNTSSIHLITSNKCLEWNKKDPVIQRNILKISPFKILGLYEPSAEVSYERLHKGKFSTQISLAYLPPDRILRNKSFGVNPSIKGGRISIEERFIISQDRYEKYYLALELTYFNTSYNYKWRAVHYQNITDSTGAVGWREESPYVDFFRVHREKFFMNAKLGYQYTYQRLVLDGFMGIGIKFLNVYHTQRDNKADHLADRAVDDINIERFRSRPGKRIDFSIPLNFRIGYLF